MISWLGTVWKIHPPLINFISLSLAVGAQQPRTHSLWVKERRIKSSPCAQLYTWKLFSYVDRVRQSVEKCVLILFVTPFPSQRIALMERSVPNCALCGCHQLTRSRKARRLHHLFYHSKVFEALKSSQSAPNWTDKHSSIFHWVLTWLVSLIIALFLLIRLLKLKYFSGERDPIISVLHFCC